MNPDKEAKWTAWIEDIRLDVVLLMDYRRRNAAFERIVNANPRLRPGQFFPDYFRSIYVDFAALAVRRLTRTHKDSISLVGLLEDLRDNNEMITRAWYHRLYKRPNREGQVYSDEQVKVLANRPFSKFAVHDNPDVVSKSIEADLQNVISATKPISDFVDRVKAHKDKRGLNTSAAKPTYDALDKAITVLAEVTTKYVSLLDGAATLSMTPIVLGDDPLSVFRFAWLDEDHKPELSDLEI